MIAKIFSIIDLQTRTSEARSSILSSQSNLDSILEGHRRSDERKTLAEQAELSSRCQEAKDFETTFTDQHQSLGHAIRTFLDEELKQDVPTGDTPSRVDRRFPKKILHGTPDDIRLKTFRATRDVSRVPFENIDNYENDVDQDSVVSVNKLINLYNVNHAANINKFSQFLKMNIKLFLSDFSVNKSIPSKWSKLSWKGRFIDGLKGELNSTNPPKFRNWIWERKRWKGEGKAVNGQIIRFDL